MRVIQGFSGPEEQNLHTSSLRVTNTAVLKGYVLFKVVRRKQSCAYVHYFLVREAVWMNDNG